MLRRLRRTAWQWRWARRQQRLVAAGWYDPAARSEARAVLIGGCPRSGTTLVRELLARHPAFANTVETAILVPGFDPARVADRWGLDRRVVVERAREARNLVELAERFYAEVAAAQGASRWIDKAPANARIIPRLLTWFPRARFIHVLRDGRDVVCSLRHHPTERLVRGRVVPNHVEHPVGECATTWVEETTPGLAFKEHGRCLELRYETLLDQPRATLERLCAFLDEPFDPSMLEPGSSTGPPLPARLVCNPNAVEPLDRSHIGRWRHELDRDDRAVVHDLAGALLEATGYATGDRWIEDPPGARPVSHGGP